MLCACCSSTSSLEIRTGFFGKSVTLWTVLQIPLWSKPYLVFRHKVYLIALSEVLATQMGVTEAQHQSQLVWTVQIWPILASQRVDSAELVHSYALGCLWVVTVCCNTVGRHGRAFCRPHAYTFSEQSKMQPHWLPRLTSLPRKSRDWWRTQDSRKSYRK